MTSCNLLNCRVHGLALLIPLLLNSVGCSDDQPPGETKSATGKVQQHTNRLAQETSPYLLLHAHNPVDWYPWGEEALDKAKRENKVIFLSVGYSSCHWCHVMERESFMDEEIAAYMNEHFVCIKVDREERPDIDAIYMSAVQIVMRRGGWPMSVFLTPAAKPFFGATYFPARDEDRPGMRGFFSIIKMVQEAWTNQRQSLIDDGDRLAAAVKQQLEARRPAALAPLDAKWLDRVQAALAEQFDKQHGGFTHSLDPQTPKFPEPSNLLFLLRRLQQTGLDETQRAAARQMLEKTLDEMAQGGIRDHIGGAFHRYSVDRFWKIPHFEKMLYDNGQLASVYSRAFAITKRATFRQVVHELLDGIERELMHESGAFYSALDAESEGEEGKFYRWTKQEVKAVVGNDFDLLAKIYGLEGEPNFEKEYYVPQLAEPLPAIAQQQDVSETDLVQKLSPLHRALLAARDRRPRPLTDTKILTSWNGLMIRGYADAGRFLDEPKYTAAAERAAVFVLKELRDENGRLYRTYSNGRAKLNAYLNDYAFLIDGLVALHETTGQQRWMDSALEIQQLQIDLFWDNQHGGFFFTSDDHESLIARGKNPADGAQPSGNSVAVGNLVYLGQHFDKADYLAKARQTVDSISGVLDVSPAFMPRMAVGFADLLDAQAK